MGRIDVRGSQELRDLLTAMNGMDADIRRYLRAFAKSKMVTPWLQSITAEASTPLERTVIAGTSTIAVGDQNVRVQAAQKGRRMSGGLQPKVDWPAVEFGADRNKVTSYVRKGHRVRRHTARQMRGRRRGGYVFWPTAEDMTPRLASLWVQTIVKGVSNLFEGRSF
jgi:hypothetical protein